MLPFAEARALIKATPLRLSTGHGLDFWLTSERGLSQGEAEWAVEEYQRFLTLALSAPEGEATMPGPLIEKLWQVHRDDARAYATFTAALGTDKLTHHRSRHNHTGDPAWEKTRARYRAAFGDIPARFWPSRWRLWGIRHGWWILLLAIYILSVVSYLGAEHPPPAPTRGIDVIGSALWIPLFLIPWHKYHRFSPLDTLNASYAQSPKATPCPPSKPLP